VARPKTMKTSGEMRELIDRLAADANASQIVRRSVPHEIQAWIACRGNGRGCPSPLFACLNCLSVGCQSAPCVQNIFDEGNVCIRCGRHAGMNRDLKFSANAVRLLWLRLHSQAP